MKLKLNRFDRHRSFRSVADFEAYAAKQVEKYEALKQSNSLEFSQWGKALLSAWSNVRAVAQDEHSDEARIQGRLNSSPVIPYSSLLRRRLQVMSENGRGDNVGEALAQLLTGRLNGQPGHAITVKAIQDYSELLSALSLEEILKNSNADAWLGDIIGDHQEKLSELLRSDFQELEAKRAEFNELVQVAAADHKSLAMEAAETMAKQRAAWEQAYNDFHEQLKTETAVELWSKRSESHKSNYRSFRKWAVGTGIGGLLISLAWIFLGFAGVRWMLPNDQTAQVSSYVAGSVVIFTLFVWGLRVLVRSMMSEDHLSTDASARSAMAHTYLALIKQGAATDSDRTIILASLFAPVSDGLVKDDGMPVLSPAALAAHSLTNPK